MTSLAENRKHKRIPVKTYIFVDGGGFSRFKSRTMDLSDGGLFIESEALAGLSIGERITIQSAEGMADAPILNARIAWTNSYGAGIEFLLD